jgi:hypothetical protein
MRLRIKRRLRPQYMEDRVVTFFAWLPVIICKGITEVRWLETVKIKQYYGSMGWINLEFLEVTLNNQQYMRFEFKKDAEVSTSDFWYDMTAGGYIKPEEILANPEQVKAVQDAIKTLKAFYDQMEDNDILTHL